MVEDTRSGKAAELTPKELYNSHEDYQHFSLEDFRKHIYQEKYRQIGGPYWQKLRNKMGLREREKAVKEMRREWGESKFAADMADIEKRFSNI